MVIEFIYYVQHSTFWDLEKIKKILDIGLLKIFN